MNIPVLNVWDETQNKYVGIPAISGGGGGGGSVPKPLTYDYMPEGYPKKEAVEVTLFDKAFYVFDDGFYFAGFEFISLTTGKTYVVYADGVRYECVCYNIFDSLPAIGNAALSGKEGGNGEPFFVFPADGEVTFENAANTTVSLKIAELAEAATPISYDFMPEGYPKIGIKPVTIFDQTVEGYVESDGAYRFEIQPDAFRLVAGDKYTVVFDGVKYPELICYKLGEGLAAIGADLTSEMTEELPFFIVAMEGGLCEIVTISPEPFHTVSVAHMSEVVTPMDDRFMGNSTFVVNATMGGSNWVESYDKTYEEVAAAFDAGKPVICNALNSDGTVLFRNLIAYTHNEKGVWFTGFDSRTWVMVTISLPAPNKSKYCWTAGVVTVNPEFGREHFILNNYEYFERNTLIVESSTAGSTKRFSINVDDTGAITATEVI